MAEATTSRITKGRERVGAEVRAWTWRPNGPCRSVGSWSDIVAAWNKSEGRLWIDLQDPRREDLDELDRLIGLDEEAREDCVKGPVRPRVDEYETYVAIFFFGLATDETEEISSRRVAVFCGDRFLVTVHTEPLLSITSLFSRCRRHGVQMFERGVDVLLYRLVDTLVDNYLEVLDQLDESINQLEIRSIDPTADDGVLEDTARLRVDLMEVRRLASAQRSLLSPLVRGELDFISAEVSTEFRHVAEHLAHAIDLANGMRERLTGVMSSYHSTLAKQTNDTVRVLTVFAAVLLPLSLISSVYGMNVPVWPPGDWSHSFSVILTAMGIVAGALLWFFRSRQWF